MSLLPCQTEAIAAVDALRARIGTADADTLALLLTEARTHSAFTDQPVSDALLHQAVAMAAMGPTSMNCQPLRIRFVRSAADKARLVPLLAPGNQAKTAAAPVTAIVAYDAAFYEQMPKVFPINAGARDMFAGNPALAQSTAFRNGSLQAAYFLIALRAAGLDCGPMSGFDPAGVDAAFFAGSTVRTNFLINIGYGDTAGVFPRLPRLSVAEMVLEG